MSKHLWMPLDIDAYLGDTGHLTAAEHGAYMLLIMRYWKDRGLPSDEALIARYSKMTPEQWAESRGIIAAFFSDGWKHDRIEAELAKADEIVGKRRAAAEQKHSKSDAHAVHMQSKSTYTRVPPSPKPSSSLRSDDAPAKPTPREELEKVLDASHAGDVLEHRQRLRKPLTAKAARLLAEKFAQFPDANAAADRMIGNGWLKIEPGWGEPRAGPAQPAKDTPANAAKRRIEALQNERRNGTEAHDHQQVAGLISGNTVRLVG